MPASTRLAIGVLIALAAWGIAYWLTPASGPRYQPAVGDAGVAEGAGAPMVSVPRRGASDIGRDVERAAGSAVAREGAGDDAREDAAAGSGGPPDGGVGGEGVGGGVIAPEFEWYVVQRGDSAESISRKLYGTRRYWASILRANPLEDLDRNLRAGMRIRVPVDPTNVQGRPANGGEGQGSAGEALPAYVEYTVRRGDTLSEIAARVYGSGARWTLIRDANVEKTGRDGTKIRPGMVLRLPPKPAE